MSKLGFILCFLYLVVVAFCVWGAIDASSDPKGTFVLLQLPLALQLAILDSLGLSSALYELSWPAAYVLIGLPTLGLLYCVGWVLDKSVGSPSHRGD